MWIIEVVDLDLQLPENRVPLMVGRQRELAEVNYGVCSGLFAEQARHARTCRVIRGLVGIAECS